MPDKPKSIMLPASAQSAIAAVERYATEHDVALGAAAAELIGRGIAARIAPAEAPATLDDLLDQVRERFATQEQASVDAAVAERRDKVEAAEARALAAEARAAAAEEQVARARAIFA